MGWEAPGAEAGVMVVEFRGAYHVIPSGDVWRHRVIGCWCLPAYDHDGLALSPVWIHHRAVNGSKGTK